MSGQYPPPPPNQPPNQPPGQPGQPGQGGQPSWGAQPPPSYQPTQAGWTPQYPAYGGGPTGPTGPTGPYPGYQPPGGPGGQGGGSGKGLLVTTIVVGAVAVIAAITTMIIVLTGDDGDEKAGDGDSTSQTDEPTSETEDPTESTEPTEPTSEADPDPGGGSAPDDAVALGTPGTVGNWTITVTKFDDDADAEIAEANQFNDPPSGRYVLVTLNATWNGSGQGDTTFGLGMAFVTPDGTEHKDYDCGAVEPNSTVNAPKLKKGDSLTFDTCFDVPVDSASSGYLTVNQDFDQATETAFAL